MRTLLRGQAALAQLDEASRRTLESAAMVFFALCGACLTGLLAQVRVPLPFTPVPVTGQVFAVLVCGALLGSGYGALSQCLYVGLGLAGVPWFNGATGGLAMLAGPTGGYLLGFVMAALFLGTMMERSRWALTFQGRFLLMLAAVAILYFFGAVQLMILLRLSPVGALGAGVVPFVAVDIPKALLAASVTGALLRRRAA